MHPLEGESMNHPNEKPSSEGFDASTFNVEVERQVGPICPSWSGSERVVVPVPWFEQIE